MIIPHRHLWRGGGRQAGGEVREDGRGQQAGGVRPRAR